MNKQQKEILQAQLDSEKQTIKELKQVYNQALKDVNEKISLLSARADMNPPELQSIIYQKQYQQAIKGQLEGIMANLQSNEYATISDYLTRCYQDGYIGTMYDIQGQGIPLIIPIDQKQVTKAIQTDSKLSKNLYDRLGEDVSKLKTSVRAEISRGIANGSSWNEMAAKISSSMKNTPFEKAINNSIRIARTEGHRIQNQSALDAQQKAKSKGADIVKQWDATLDGATRETHRKLDGQIREIDEPFEVDGMKADCPGGFGDPAEDCNCRCALLQRARWALDESELETLKERAEFFELDKTDDFEEYKEKFLVASDFESERNEWIEMNEKFSSPDEAFLLGDEGDFERYTELNNKFGSYIASEIEKPTLPDFNYMRKSDLISYANDNIMADIDFSGASDEAVKTVVSTMARLQNEGIDFEGLNVKFGRPHKDAYAFYDSKTNEIYIPKNDSFVKKMISDDEKCLEKWGVPRNAVSTYEGNFLHELGHYVDYQQGQALSRELSNDAELLKESYKISFYASSQSGMGSPRGSESFAENFSAYFSGNEDKVADGVKEIIEKACDYSNGNLAQKINEEEILNELQSKSNKKVDITDIAIDKVQAISLEGYSTENMDNLQQQHKELLKIAQKDNDSNEVAQIFDLSFDNAITVLGSETEVSLNESIDVRTLMYKAPKESIIVIHNHPSGSSFSYDDIGVFMQSEIKTLTVVTNQGKVYALNKTESFDILGIFGKIEEIRNEYDNPLEHQEELCKKILKAMPDFGIEYKK